MNVHTECVGAPNTINVSLMRVFALAFLTAVLLVVAPSAEAAKPTGIPVALIDISHKQSALRAPGVRIHPSGKAVHRFGKLGFTIVDVRVTGIRRGTFLLKDGFRLKRGRRSVNIRAMLVYVKANKVRITAKIGSRRQTLFTGRARRAAETDSTRTALTITGAKLTISHGAARTIRRKLRRFKPRRRSVGAFNASAAVIPPAPGGPTVDPDNARQCIAPTGETATDAAKPAGAVDVSCGYFIWAFRSSFIDYNSSTTPIAPALALPPVRPAEHYCPVSTTNKTAVYYFRLPVSSGWWDPASGTADIRLSGGLYLLFVEHSLDIRLTEIDLHINGVNSEMWTSVKQVDAGGGVTNSRIKFATFNATAPSVGGPVGPGTSLTRYNTYFTADGSTLMLNYYPAGGGAGCFDLGFNF